MRYADLDPILLDLAREGPRANWILEQYDFTKAYRWLARMTTTKNSYRDSFDVLFIPHSALLTRDFLISTS